MNKVAYLLISFFAILAFSSCNKDSDDSFTYRFELTVDSTAPTASAEAEVITKAFETALGGKEFKKEGSQVICDLQVLGVCNVVQDRLKDNKWNGSYTAEVFNVTMGGQPIYTYTFSSPLEIKPSDDEDGE